MWHFIRCQINISTYNFAIRISHFPYLCHRIKIREIGKELFQRLFVDVIQLITKLKSNMKGALMSMSDRLLTRKRAKFVELTLDYNLILFHNILSFASQQLCRKINTFLSI